jgi:hypothetical protein
MFCVFVLVAVTIGKLSFFPRVDASRGSPIATPRATRDFFAADTEPMNSIPTFSIDSKGV